MQAKASSANHNTYSACGHNCDDDEAIFASSWLRLFSFIDVVWSSPPPTDTEFL